MDCQLKYPSALKKVSSATVVFIVTNLISILKSDLTNFVGTLSPEKILELDSALAVALGLFQGS